MNKNETERLIFKKLNEIFDIMLEFDDDFTYLSACLMTDDKWEDGKYISFNNDYMNKSDDKKIDFTSRYAI